MHHFPGEKNLGPAQRATRQANPSRASLRLYCKEHDLSPHCSAAASARGRWADWPPVARVELGSIETKQLRPGDHGTGAHSLGALRADSLGSGQDRTKAVYSITFTHHLTRAPACVTFVKPERLRANSNLRIPLPRGRKLLARGRALLRKIPS
jgi:hypothetical protein